MCDLKKNTELHTEGAPVVVVGHLSHNLAVDLVLQSFMLGGWTKDLVCQLYRTASLFDGVVAHVLQDRLDEVKETRLWSVLHMAFVF